MTSPLSVSISSPTITLKGAIRFVSRAPAMELWSVIARQLMPVSRQRCTIFSGDDIESGEYLVCTWRSAFNNLFHLLTYSFHISAAACVDADDIPIVDEEGDLHGDACLQFGWLRPRLGCIPLEAGAGLGDFQFHVEGHLHSHSLVAVPQNHQRHAFPEVFLEDVAQLRCTQGDLLEALDVHEIV